MTIRVLVVEDSATQAAALRALLEGEGYAVAVAVSGEEAIAQVPHGQFDLVVADIVMAGMNGYDLCRRIKTDLGRRDLPVVLLTTLGDPMDIVRGLECGADNYVTKPYEAERLVARLRHVVAARERRRSGTASLGITIHFLGTMFTISSEKEQILDLLISSVEDVVRACDALRQSEQKLAEAHTKLDAYARRIANQARVTSEKYWALMQHAADAILVLDTSGGILEANARATELLGRPLDSLLTQPFESFVFPAEVQYFRLQFAKLGKIRRVEACNLRLVDAAGQLVCCDCSAALVPGAAEDFVLAILRDVTSRNALERETVRSERLAAIGTLMAGVAHEINNPIAFLLANSERLLECSEKLSARGDADLAAAAEEIRESARQSAEALKHVGTIVRELKSFTRTDDEDLAGVNVNDCVESAATMALSEIKSRATLERDYAELPAIAVSPGQLVQVFLNLLVNAAQAIAEGGPARNRIRVETRSEGEWISVSVSDTGRGIPPELVGRLFEAHFTTKPVGTGTGLGLYICRKIVQGYGGRIEVQSQPGRGTTFTVSLPTETGRTPSPEPAEPAGTAPATSRQRILLVDDEAYLLRVYDRALGRTHQVTAALGGRQAMEILAQAADRFDVVISDLLMPEVDGIELYEYLRAHHPRLAARTIFMTGGAATLRAREFLAALATPSLEKPFDIHELLRRVAEVAGAAG